MNRRIGFIGAGQMARALATGFVQARLVTADQIHAADVSIAAAHAFEEMVTGATMHHDNSDLIRASDIVFLAVKPQQVGAVIEGLAGTSRDDKLEDKLIVSIVAGTRLRHLMGGFGERVVRVMPNTACLVGVGASAYSLGPGATREDGELVGQLLGSVGIAVRLPEPLLDAVTGLSGSGPAFVYQMIEALSDGGVAVGLPRDVAQRLAAQTVLGAATMVIETGEHPAVLKDRVASPGGTTIAGLIELERGCLRATVMAAVGAAAARSAELGEG